jgi:hypothetical protein
MLNFERIQKDDRQMRAMTGMNLKAFNALVPSFEAAYQESLIQAKPWRMRAIGGGRKPKLRTTEDKLFYILVYSKCYPTFDVMGSMFNFDRSCAHDWVHKLMPVLEKALGYSKALPEREIRSMEEFVEKFPDIEKIIIDGTERPIQRSKDPKEQKENYSGKKNDIREST